VQQLDIELLFPATLAATPAAEAALQRRRGRVRRAELTIEQAALNRSLAAVVARFSGAGQPSALPFDLVKVRIDGSEPQPGILMLFRCPNPNSARSCETDDGTERGPLWGTARIAARRPPPGATDIVLGISEVRIYGQNRLAAPLLGHALLKVLGAALLACPPSQLPVVILGNVVSPLGLHLLGTPALSELRSELLHDALLDLLPRAGYRAADPTTAPLCELQVLPGQLLLRYSAEGQRTGGSYSDFDERPRSNPVIEPASLLLGAPLPEPLRIADYLLYSGDPCAALAAYQLVESSALLSQLSRTRRLQILTALPDHQRQATELAEAELSTAPGHAAALVALASIALSSGQPEAAARRYLALGADTHSHPLERAAAFFAASRCLVRADPGASRSTRAAAESLLAPGGPEEPLLEAIQAAAQEVPRKPLTRPPQAPAPAVYAPAPAAAPPHVEVAEPWKGAIEEAQRAAQTGDIERSRALLMQAGSNAEVLRARVQLDWPELMQAEPGSPGDLLPVLRELLRLGAARPEELRGLARLLTARGEYAAALDVQEQAGGDPDELLASLEAAGRSRELLAALAVHAAHRPESACLLHQQAANVAEHQLGDLALAAACWQQAAEVASTEPMLEDAALLWFHAGRLWHEHGDASRAYAVLGRAMQLGGSSLPRLTLLLADLAYTLGDLEAASLYYRQALDAGQVPAASRAQAYLRIAENAQKHEDAQTEEQALARAVEAGAGAQAWPRLAALFRSQRDSQRLGAALLAWADHEPPAPRIVLLREAATLVQPALLPRLDEELIKLDADDEAVRDRVIQRSAERGEQGALLLALRRDVQRSHGRRQRNRARRMIDLALKLSDYAAAVEGWLAILREPSDAPGHLEPAESLVAELPETVPDTQPEELPGEVADALTFWSTLQRTRASLHVPAAALEKLRQRIVESGQLAQRWVRIETRLDLLSYQPEPGRRSRRQALLLSRAAEMAELLGYFESAAQRYLQLCACVPADAEALGRLRRVLRGLAQAGRAEEALALVDSELRRLGPAAGRLEPRPPADEHALPPSLGAGAGLRIALAELLMFLGRTSEALGQLELVLLRAPHAGPAHALLGMLLGTSVAPDEVHRGLEHLLVAAYAPDVEPHEAGECALMAADMLASAGISEPVDLATLRAMSAAVPGYAERAAAGTFVAVPTDFLEPALAEDAGQDKGSGKEVSFRSERHSALPQLLGPVELLLHAAALLPSDPRPLEGLLGLTWSRGEYAQAAECCDRLLALPTVVADPLEASRIRVEKAHVLLRLGRKDEAEALLRRALAEAPGSAAALRALRRLLCESDRGQTPEALELLRAEMKVCPVEDRAGLAVLWNELGQLQSRLGHPAEALAAWRRAGQMGLASGWQKLAEGLAEQGDWLEAADAAGRGAMLLPAASGSLEEAERGQLLLRAAEMALRADDELRARDYLTKAAAAGGASGEAAEERLRDLDGGSEPEKRRRTLELRLNRAGSGIERLEILRRLVVLCAEVYERPAMVSYANTLLREAPGDALALCALAEDALEHGRTDVAVSRITQAGAIPPHYPRPTRLLACLGEALERQGNMPAATSAYQRLLEAAERRGDIPAIDLAIEGLARLYEEQGDAAEALRWLRRRLPHIPPDAAAARATLRLRMSDLAVTLGALDEARQQLDAVLEESPGQRSALVKLLDVYRQRAEPQAALRVLDRLLDLTMTPGERAEWLFARAELYEKQLGNLGEAAALYDQVLSQWPAHARALRRVIALAVQRGDGAKVAAAVAALGRASTPLADVQVLAGLGLLMVNGGAAQDKARTLEAQALLRGAAADDLAAALSTIRLEEGLEASKEKETAKGGSLRRLDGPLSGAVQALGGDAAALLSALRRRMQQSGAFAPNTVAVLARLCEHLGLGAQGLYLSMLAFLDPGGYADEKLDELGALPVPETALETALMAVRPLSPEQAPWLVVFGLLGRHVLGVQTPEPPSSARSPEWAQRLDELARSLGLSHLEVVLVESQTVDPAACEPTRPPRLRLLRALTADEPQARFAALRALYLLQAGVPLCEQAGPAEMAALLRAAAALWLEGTPDVPRVEDVEVAQELLPREREWLAMLRALALHPEHAPGVLYEARAEAEAIKSCLNTLAEKPQRLAELWPGLMATARLEAGVRALGQLGDVRAALRALFAPLETAAPSNREQRLAALSSGPLADLLSVTVRLYD